ncbi:porin [Polaromonas sp.]|uniref:porin n=1 Tax=Polaromonas sp. TaxID=1869339 RepID=UPI002D1FA0F3|nr:porin [Polaromonas sp.]
MRGEEALGDGIKAKCQLESGFAADTGASAETTRLFDRQAWVGFGTPGGDVRLGRQNGVVFGAGSSVDFTARTLGFGESAGRLRA